MSCEIAEALSGVHDIPVISEVIFAGSRFDATERLRALGAVGPIVGGTATAGTAK